MADPPNTAPGAEPPSRSLSPRDEPGLDLAPLKVEFLLGYFDLAITGALEYSRNQGIYLSPWWDLPSDTEDLRGWKRAVLRKDPHGGADHWGHIFLVVLEGRGTVTLAADHPVFGVSRSAQRPVEVPLRAGRPRVVLFLRPTYPSTKEALLEFGRDVVDRFRKQRD